MRVLPHISVTRYAHACRMSVPLYVRSCDTSRCLVITVLALFDRTSHRFIFDIWSSNAYVYICGATRPRSEIITRSQCDIFFVANAPRNVPVRGVCNVRDKSRVTVKILGQRYELHTRIERFHLSLYSTRGCAVKCDRRG